MLKHSRFIVKEYFKFDAHWKSIKNLKVDVQYSSNFIVLILVNINLTKFVSLQFNAGVWPK